MKSSNTEEITTDEENMDEGFSLDSDPRPHRITKIDSSKNRKRREFTDEDALLIANGSEALISFERRHSYTLGTMVERGLEESDSGTPLGN